MRHRRKVVFIMQRPISLKCRKKFWLIVLATFLSWFLLLSTFFLKASVKITSLSFPANSLHQTPNFTDHGDNDRESTADKSIITSTKPDDDQPDTCIGRYIYIHDLPSKFNQDLIQNCKSLSNWTDMCTSISNDGLGPQINNLGKVYSQTGWYSTNQFLLEVIFHNKIKNYECLVKNSSLASAIFVPYYAGLDVSQHLWGSSMSERDSNPRNLVKWLGEQPEWRKMGGRDHFLVAGRITWDFRRPTDEESDWGNKLLYFPESKNMTVLVIESSPWNNTDFAIPYPTYFHPSSDKEVFEWQDRMRKQKRRTLFSFAGGPRPNLKNSIRDKIIRQCQASRKRCKFLECVHLKPSNCYKPGYVMKMFQGSVFCLQPPGDSFTRRSAFDSILAGCIPVFFHPGSAYVQYIWHLPIDHTKYSVFIPGNEIQNGKARIEKILLKIDRKKVASMREEVIRLIPKIIYSHPSSKLERFEDAFDITIKGILERMNTMREEMEDGKNWGFDFPEDVTWKYFLYGTVGGHEWDPFFAKYRM